MNCTNLIIFHQNICGISNKINELEAYIQTLGQKVDYLCLTEHFLNNVSVSSFNLDGYKLASYNTRNKKKRGGSLILAQADRKVENVIAIDRLYVEETFELCCIKDTTTGVYVCCVYRNTNDRNFIMFMKKMELLLEFIFNKKCIICGDYNVDLLLENKKRAEFLSLLACYNFRCLFDSPTFIRNNSYSCLDNIITNLQEERVLRSVIDHNALGDGHGAQLGEFLLENMLVNKNNQCLIINKRIFNCRNSLSFRDRLLHLNWSAMGINSFLKNFNNAFRKSYKKREIKIHLKRGSQLKWVTKGVKTSSKMKRVLCTNTGNHLHESVLNYKNKYIRIYRRVMTKAKKIAVREKIDNFKNVSKEVWKVINNSTNRVKKVQQEPLLLKIDDKIIDSPTAVANILAKQFNHSSDTSETETEEALLLLQQSCERVINDMSLTPTTPKEVTQIIKTMTNKHSSGYDEIPIAILKEHIKILAGPLSTFFNNCLEQGIFPEQLKIAKVVPVYKKGSKKDPKNYRPISLLPTLSKIFEKILKSRLLTYLHLNKVLHERQFGYHKGIGTGDAIYKLLDDVISKINHKLKVAGIFLDLSSAFDTIDHNLLIAKLNHYGVRGRALQLFTSYLRNRKMYVETSTIEQNGQRKAYQSSMINITTGVPQGSILGPILFIVFTNDLINYIKKNKPDINLVVFADDTNAVVGAKSISELTEKVNTTLAAFQFWFNTNRLIINIKKTNIMLFRTTAGNKENMDITLNNAKIELVREVKFLGILLDDLLNWKKELANIDSTISSACYALRTLRDVIDTKHLKMVYYALVESRLRYSIQFWGKSYGYNSQRAFILQKRAIRTIARITQRESCRSHFQHLHILTLPSLYILVLLVNFKKYIHEYESGEERIARENTRRKDLKNKVIPNFNIVKHSPHYQAVQIFNRLPADLKILLYTSSFKAKLKAFLLDRNLYSIEEL